VKASIRVIAHLLLAFSQVIPENFEDVVNRDQTLALLTKSKSELAQRYGVTRLSLCGSAARDKARIDSDVDILVGFDGPATSSRFFGVQFYLEDLLGRRVDLVTEKALRAQLRPYIEREAISV
jgi:predicted nucleotidyltransferase